MQQRRRDLELAGAPIPNEWEETVSACLAKDPNQRPQTAGEIAKRLGLAVPWYQTPNVVDGARAKTVTVAGAERSTRNSKHRSKLIIAGVIMAFLLIASVFAWFSVLTTEERRVLLRGAETQAKPQAVQQQEQEQTAKEDEQRRKLAEQQGESVRKRVADAEAKNSGSLRNRNPKTRLSSRRRSKHAKMLRN